MPYVLEASPPPMRIVASRLRRFFCLVSIAFKLQVSVPVAHRQIQLRMQRLHSHLVSFYAGMSRVPRRPSRLRCMRSRRQEAARSDCSILRIRP